MFLWLSCRSLSSTTSIPGTTPRNVWPSILISNSISPRISTYRKLAIIHPHVLYTSLSQKWKGGIYSNTHDHMPPVQCDATHEVNNIHNDCRSYREEWQYCWSCATRQSTTVPASIKPRSIKATCIISSDSSDLLLLAGSGYWMHISYHILPLFYQNNKCMLACLNKFPNLG